MAQDPSLTMRTKMGSRKWKVAHVIATNFFGGPEKQIVEHLKRLDPSVYSSRLISFLEDGRENQILRQAQMAGIEQQGISMGSPFDFRAWRQLQNFVRAESIDLFCVHGYKSTVMGAWIHKTLGIPTLAFSRGYTAENLKVALYQYCDRLALRLLSGVVCVSEGQRRKLAALGVCPKRSWVVHNAVQAPETLPDFHGIRLEVCRQLALPADALLCVSAGRLSPEKGHADLLRAIAEIGDRAPAWYFMLCGDGPCRARLQQQIHALRLQQRVRLAGFRTDIQDIFQAMDLFVLPSHSEGLPNVVLEAFALGKPVIATSVGGVPEIIENGVNGVLVPPRQPSVLAEAMVRCFHEPARMAAWGQAARRTVQTRFTFEEQNRRLEGIYAEILDPFRPCGRHPHVHP
jgi:glycosyltransferase involved in cell wall biosynthesis